MSVQINKYGIDRNLMPFVKEAGNNLYKKTKNKNYLLIDSFKDVKDKNFCILRYLSLSGMSPSKNNLENLFLEIIEEANILYKKSIGETLKEEDKKYVFLLILTGDLGKDTVYCVYENKNIFDKALEYFNGEMDKSDSYFEKFEKENKDVKSLDFFTFKELNEFLNKNDFVIKEEYEVGI